MDLLTSGEFSSKRMLGESPVYRITEGPPRAGVGRAGACRTLDPFLRWSLGPDHLGSFSGLQALRSSLLMSDKGWRVGLDSSGFSKE